MKRCLVCLCLCVLMLSPNVRAQSADDLFIRIHSMILEADTLSERGQVRQALDKYSEAHTTLTRLQRGFPEWAPEVVKFRLGYLESRMAALKPEPGAAAAPSTIRPPAQGPGTTVPAPAAAWEQQAAALQQEIAALKQSNALLEAKLKEALAAVPAPLDPQELKKAEQKNLELQKENELLQASVSELQAKPAGDTNALAEADAAVQSVKAQLKEQQDLVERLSVEKTALQNQLKTLETPAVDTAALDKAQGELEQVRQQLAAQTEKVTVLEQEKQALQVTIRNQQPAPSVDVAALKRELANAKEQLVQATRDKEALQAKLRAASQPAVSTGAGDEAVAGLRARLAALEAEKVPFTPEELALMAAPTPTVPTAPVKASDRQPLATTAPLLAEAQRHFTAGEFNQAALKYQLAIEQDPQNPLALANLAVIQTELNQLDAAEKTVRQALALAPEDAFAYSTLGQIKYRQGQYDEAVEALSRGAKLDQKSAEIQSRLGIVLSQKGQRGPAETAFRKALQLQPGYAPAHLNLAVLYASQTPPLGELAKWHYQKAVRAGSAKNPELEKLIENARAAAQK